MERVLNDKVLLVRDYNNVPPVNATVTRLTTKWFFVTVEGEVKETGPFSKATDVGVKDASMSVHDLNKLEQLEERAASKKRYDEEKRAQEEEQQAAIKAEHERQLLETKQAFGGVYALHRVLFQTNNDDSVLMVFNMPLKAGLEERKGGWETAIVLLRKTERFDFRSHEYKKMVEVNMTYNNGSSHSFPSCSWSYHDNEDEAIWEVLNDVYQRRSLL